MIDALFGSKTRVKLLHLFLNHPGQSFYVREITRLVDEQINSVRRELSNMLQVGVILSKTADNKLFYEVNQRYEYYPALRAIFANDPIEVSSVKKQKSSAQQNEQYSDILSGIPAIRLAIVSGVLVPGSQSPLDIILVGTVSSTKVRTAVNMIEKLEGRELNYAVLPYDDFYYRLSMRDRFILEVIGGKHVVIIDKDNILSQK